MKVKISRYFYIVTSRLQDITYPVNLFLKINLNDDWLLVGGTYLHPYIFCCTCWYFSSCLF